MVTRAQRKHEKASAIRESDPDHMSLNELWKARRARAKARAKARREEKLKSVNEELEENRRQLQQQREEKTHQTAQKPKSESRRLCDCR